MADYDLGTARGTIDIDASGAVSGFNSAQRAHNEMVSNMDQAAGTLIASGAAIAAVGVGIAAGFGVAVKSAADFETGMNAIQAVSGATAGEMETLRQKSLDLGAQTSFSAGEAAGAIENLVKAGVSVPDVMNGAADATVALAAAGSIDLPAAADLAANAMNAFSLGAEEMPHIADLIAGAANASAIDVGDFAMSLSQAGAMANLVGLSIDDTAVAIAALGNAGIKGSDAGTSLKTMLSNLQPTTEKQIGLFQELGLMTADGANQFFNANGSIKSMAEISGTLNNALQGMSDQQKTMALETMFGSDAIRAAAVIAETGSQGFTDLAGAMAKTSAADVAATRMKGLNGAIDAAKGSMETLMIQVGTPLLGFFTKLTTGLTGLINWFSSLSDTQMKVIITITAIIGALSLFVGGMLMAIGVGMKLYTSFLQLQKAIAFVKTLNLITRAQTALNASFLANPVFLVVAAIIALGVALFVLYKKSETFRNLVDGLWQTMQRAWDAVLNFFKGIPEKASAAVETVKKVFNEFWPLLVPGGALILLWRKFGDDIKLFVGNAVNAVIAWFQALPGRITTFVGQVVTAVTTFLSELPMKFAYGLGLVLGTIVRWTIDGVLAFIDFQQRAIAAIITFVTEAPGKLIEFATTTYNNIVTWVTNMVNKAIELGTNFLANLVRFFSELPGKIWAFLLMLDAKADKFRNDMIAKAIDLGTRFINSIVTFFKELPGKIQSFISDTYNKVTTWVSDMVGKARGMAQDFFDAATNKVREIPGEMKNIFDRIVQAIKDKIRDAFNAVRDFGKEMWRGFKEGLDMHSPSIIERAMFNITDNVGSEVDTLAGQVSALRSVAGTINGIDTGGSNTPYGGGTGAGGVTVNFEFSGVSGEDAAAIKNAVSSREVLSALTQAARAGRK